MIKGNNAKKRNPVVVIKPSVFNGVATNVVEIILGPIKNPN